MSRPNPSLSSQQPHPSDPVVAEKTAHFFEKVRRWGQTRSLWPFPVASACCGLEYAAALGPPYNASRVGLKSDAPIHPSQADLMIVTGTVTEKNLPFIKDIYRQMPGPKWVIAMGGCAAGEGPYASSYHVLPGIGEEIPVDISIPGCPPTPEAFLYGVQQLKEIIGKGVFH